MHSAERSSAGLERLLSHYAPGQSRRMIERNAGLTEGAVARWFKASTRPAAIPARTVAQLAASLDAPVSEVLDAFAAALGLPVEPRSMTLEQRRVVQMMAQAPLVQAEIELAVRAVRDAARRGAAGSPA